MNNLKLKTNDCKWMMEGKCPSCQNKIGFAKMNTTGILANIESKNVIPLKNFWIVNNKCNNPLCKWSKKNTDSLNYTNIDKAWELTE